MHIGELTIELLSEGRFELFQDGHINRASRDAPSSLEEEVGQSTMVGINPILVQTGPFNLLIDTGLGWGLDAGSSYEDVSNIRTNLEIFGLDTDDITHVILSHLHYDHAAGSSFVNEEMRTRPTFANATYFLHQREWEHAVAQAQKPENSTSYRIDELYRLKADKHIRLLKGERTTILEGVTVILSGGHTPGHQIVRLHSGDESSYYLGDLLPSSLHLNYYGMQRLDTNPIMAKKKKRQLLLDIFQEQAVLLFYHSKTRQSGRLIRDEDEQYVLADIAKE